MGERATANLQDFVPGARRTYREGERNDSLFRRACGLRRKDFSQEQIEHALHTLNRRCDPPLEPKELQKIAASAMRYQSGGPTQLDSAWSKVNGQHPSRYQTFLALAAELQSLREGLSVALPIGKISELLGCAHQLVSRYRRRAEAEGIMTLAERYCKPMKRAATYRVDPERVSAFLSGRSLVLHPSHSLVLHPENHSSATHLSSAPVALSLLSGSSATPPQLLSLMNRGFRIFPCKPKEKKPAIMNWLEQATCDAERLSQWMEQFPDCNWAVACGERSGLWVLDIDGEAGLFSCLKMRRENGGKNFQAINTLASRTAAGYHLFFRYPEKAIIRNSAGRLASGIDVRGEGGYALLPSSIHPSGHRYEWIDEHAEIAEAPAWILSLVTEPKPIVSTSWGDPTSFNYGWNLQGASA
jgi:hypothetical protein